MTEAVFTAELARWVREQRAALGMTQEELADAIGVSDASISNWESGSRRMSAYAHACLRAHFRQQGKLRGAQEVTR